MLGIGVQGAERWGPSGRPLLVNTTSPQVNTQGIRQSLFEDGIEDEANMARHLRDILFSTSSSADREGVLDFLGPDFDATEAPVRPAHGVPIQLSEPLSMTLSQMLADEEDLLMLTSVPELEHGHIRSYSPASAAAAITAVGPTAQQACMAAAARKPLKAVHQLDSIPPIKTQSDAGGPAPGCWDWTQVQYQLILPSLPPAPASASAGTAGLSAGAAQPAPGRSTFASSQAMQKAYAAAANRFLWKLNVLEGASAPADPYSNGLCQELSALMSELDQGLTNCLVHLGVDKTAICQLLAGNFKALPEPHEVQTMRQLLKLRLSFITIFTKAVSTAAVPSLMKSPTSNSPVFSHHSGGSNRGTPTAAARGRGPAPAPAPGPGTRGSSTSSGNSSRGATPKAAAGGAPDTNNAVRLAAAAGLAAEIRQKVVERFNQKLRANACQLWAVLHVLNPKPSRTDKEMLMAYTSKTSKQVTDWFTNWRARHWRPGMQTLARQMGYGGQEAADDPNPSPHY